MGVDHRPRCRCRVGPGRFEVRARIERFAEPAVLLLLAEGDGHGYRLAEDLEELLDEGRLDFGNLYRLLRSLEEEGLVASTWSEEAPGPQRRVYCLTGEGAALLDAWAASLRARSERIGALLARYEALSPATQPRDARVGETHRERDPSDDQAGAPARPRGGPRRGEERALRPRRRASLKPGVTGEAGPAGAQRPGPSVFEELADRYDAWYDSAHGRLLFDLELACLRPLLPPGPGPRLEVGVGSGRFAAALGLEVGIDPARTPLRLAAGRAVAAVQGAGERLPFGDRTFGAVVLVVTLCFADDPAALLGEARRVLVPSGRLVAGVVPPDSAWGRRYEAQGRAGHPFYQGARFLTLAGHRRMLTGAGFTVTGACSTLTQAPSDDPVEEDPQDGVVSGAGFVALQARPQPPL